MITCPNCGSQMDDACKFCRACGAKLSAPQQPPVTPTGNVSQRLTVGVLTFAGLAIVLAVVVCVTVVTRYKTPPSKRAVGTQAESQTEPSSPSDEGGRRNSTVPPGPAQANDAGTESSLRGIPSLEPESPSADAGTALVGSRKDSKEDTTVASGAATKPAEKELGGPTEEAGDSEDTEARAILDRAKRISESPEPTHQVVIALCRSLLAKYPRTEAAAEAQLLLAKAEAASKESDRLEGIQQRLRDRARPYLIAAQFADAVKVVENDAEYRANFEKLKELNVLLTEWKAEDCWSQYQKGPLVSEERMATQGISESYRRKADLLKRGFEQIAQVQRVIQVLPAERAKTVNELYEAVRHEIVSQAEKVFNVRTQYNQLGNTKLSKQADEMILLLGDTPDNPYYKMALGKKE